MKKLLKELMKNILGGIIGTLLILGLFLILGLLEQLILNHYWLMIPLSILALYMLIKEIS